MNYFIVFAIVLVLVSLAAGFFAGLLAINATMKDIAASLTVIADVIRRERS